VTLLPAIAAAALHPPHTAGLVRNPKPMLVVPLLRHPQGFHRFFAGKLANRPGVSRGHA